MNTIYSFTYSFVVCSFAVLIINYFVPKGNLKGITSLVLMLFMLVSVIKPIKNINNFRLENEMEESDTQANLENNTAGAFKSSIRLMTDSVLKENGINDYELILELDKVDSEVVIREYKILINDKSKIELIKGKILEKVGIEPEISVIE